MFCSATPQRDCSQYGSTISSRPQWTAHVRLCFYLLSTWPVDTAHSQFVTFLSFTTASRLYHLRQICGLDKIDELTKELRYSTAVSTQHGEECRTAIEVAGGEMEEDHKGTTA